MNKIITILIILIVIVFAIAGVVWFMRSQSPVSPGTDNNSGVVIPSDSNSSGTSQVPQSASSVQAAFKNSLGTNNPDNIIPTDTVIAGNFALQSWEGQVTGGEALMKYDSTTGRWNVVMSSGGSWSMQELINAGVSQSVAQTLIAGAGN